MTYVAPYGRPLGLVARLLDWAGRMGTDRTLPWAGLGIIGDIKLAAQLLNAREFLEHLRTHGPVEHSAHVRDLLAAIDTVEAVESAVYTAADRVDLGPDGEYTDPPRAVETLAGLAVEARRDYDKIRDVLVEVGALDDSDESTPIADLVRALLA